MTAKEKKRAEKLIDHPDFPFAFALMNQMMTPFLAEFCWRGLDRILSTGVLASSKTKRRKILPFKAIKTSRRKR